MDNTKLFNELNEKIKSYESDHIEIVEGLDYNQYRTLNKIEYYWNSRYVNGQTDPTTKAVKPFYNISKFRVNVATRATDLDIKDIKVTSDDPSERVRSMLLNHEIYNWMKETNFSKTLNDFGKNRAKYGGALIKKNIKDGKLKIDLVEWKNVITDQVEILDGVIIERHWMSPIELSKRRDVWENVDEAMELADEKKGKSQTTEDKIPVFEIHGEFEEADIPGIEEPQENVYKQMMFIVAGDKKGKQVLLYQEEEKELPYRYLSWDNITGRGLGMGIVEDGFEAQMWTNDAIIAEKNVMDIAGKVFIKTNAKTLGNNILTDMENGQVIELLDGEDAKLLNLVPSSLPQFQNLVEKWNTQYERSTNTFESVTGETLPSNTPLGSVAIQSAQASSFFDYRREEAGIFWAEVFMEWVLPFLSKRLNQEHILASDFSSNELARIDEAFATYETNKMIKEKILSGAIVSPYEVELFKEDALGILNQDGKRRYIEVPKDYFKNFKAKLTIDPTGEKKNKQALLQSIFTVMTQVSSNPQILSDKNLLGLFNEMLELSGLNFSPLQLQPQQAEQQGGSSKVPQGEGQLQKQTEAVLPEAQR